MIEQGQAGVSADFTINVLRCDWDTSILFTTLGTTIAASTSKIYYLATSGFDTYVFDKLTTTQSLCYNIDSFVIENVTPTSSISLTSQCTGAATSACNVITVADTTIIRTMTYTLSLTISLTASNTGDTTYSTSY